MSWLIENPAYFWLGVAIIAVIIEAATYSLVTIWFVGGALFAILLSIFKVPFYIQVILFLISSAFLLIMTRPIIRAKMNETTKTNVNAIIGETGIVTKKVTEFETGIGKVNGQIWTIESKDKTTLEVDTNFIVVEVRGVRLIVTRKEI